MARPPILDPLFRSLRSLKGIGPQLGALMTRFFAPGEGQDSPNTLAIPRIDPQP